MGIVLVSRVCPGNEWPPLPDPVCDGEWGGCLLVFCLLHGSYGKKCSIVLSSAVFVCVCFDLFTLICPSVLFFWPDLCVCLRVYVVFWACAAPELWGADAGYEDSADPAQLSATTTGPVLLELPGWGEHTQTGHALKKTSYRKLSLASIIGVQVVQSLPNE